MRRSEVSWFGEPAVRYGNTGLAVTVAPGRGGKIVSLVGPDGTEWLAGPRLPLGPAARDGAEFTSADMCGWDECAPSIVACTMPDGTRLPDHGELWTRAWTVDGDRTAVVGESYGYTFSRRLHVTGGALRLEYEVQAGDRRIPFLWAAHPQFVAPPGTRIRLPEAPGEVIDVLQDEPVRDRWDADLATIDSLSAGQIRKFYLDPGARVGSVSLDRAGGETLTLSWDPDLLPYLGVWFDAAFYARENVVALEPATGWYDSALRALRADRLRFVEPHSTFAWWLEVDLG